MNIISKYFLVAFLLYCHFNVHAQELGMWHITDDDGLPSRTVYHTAQDHRGFIWMGTEGGICRFDGQNFKTYKSEKLNDNEILKIEIDPLGRVWFRNLSGQLFYIEDDIIHETHDLFSGGLSNVGDFAIDGHTIWVTIQNTKVENREKIEDRYKYNYQLIRLDFNEEGHFNPSYLYPQFFDKFFFSFRKSDDSFYISALPADSERDKLYSLIQLNKASPDLDVKNTIEIKKPISYLSYYILKEEIYLFVSDLQTSSIKKATGDKTKRLVQFEKKIIFNDVRLFDDQLWMLTSQGVIIKSMVDDSLKEPTYLLKNKSTNHLMVDHEGNKWISTTGNGIYVITASQTQIFRTDNFSLPNDEIYSLAYAPEKEKLLVGHSKGQTSVIDHNLENSIISGNPSGRIVDIAVDADNNYWLMNEVEPIVVSPDLTIKNPFWGLSGEIGGIKTLLQIRNKNIWVGTYGYSYLIRHESGNYINSSITAQHREEVLPIRTYAFYQDYTDAVWIGSSNGLYLHKDTLSPFLEQGKQVPYNVSFITQSIDSVVWVATRGSGMIAIKGNKVVQRFKEVDGLASNTVKKIFASPHYLWIGTDNGITKMNLKSKETEWINSLDGLPSDDVNDIEIVDDMVWVATSKGLARFSTTAQQINNVPPPIYISNIKITEKDTALQDSFSLSYHQNSIQINMIGLGYKGKGNISYQYKLSGMEKDWVHTRSAFARYPTLPPGHYTFEVFAINEDQVKSLEPAKVYFDIQPPWWRSWWFMILSFLVIGGSISYVMMARIQRQRKEQRFLEHVKELKTKALRSQMNPHFIFNALNAIQRFLTTNDSQQAMNYLSNFGKLIRLVFEHSQLEKISLEEELDFLKLYLDLEKLRFMDAIDIQLQISPFLEDISDEVYLPPLLIQPIVENSFKHGFLYKKELGVLKINFLRRDAFLICTIEDNGIGRKKAAALGQKSLKDRPASGLKTSVERLKILKADQYSNTNNTEKSELNFTDLFDEEGNVKGTLVEIKIYCPDLEPIEEL